MIICHSRKFVFFSNPKTGSESLRALFAPLNEEAIEPWFARSPASPFYPHMSPAEAKPLFFARGWDFDSYLRVTCTRNPWARMVSLYEMIRKVDRFWRMREDLGLPPRKFASWLASTRPDGRGGGGWPHQRWRRYGAWSTRAWAFDPNGAPLVNHILRLENLQDDLPAVLQALALPRPAEIPHENQRDPRPFHQYYDTASSGLITKRYAWEIETYHYNLSH